MDCSMPGFPILTISWSLLKLMESVMLPNHLFLCRPLLLLPSSIRVFSSELEKEMATHSSVLAWRIPGTGEPGGLPLMGSHRVGHDWSDLAAAAAAVHIRWPKYWSFSVSPSNEYSGLISFRIDWFNLLAVQGNLKSLLQHHNSKTPILWHSAFFLVQLSHLYVTTGKTVALTIQTFGEMRNENSTCELFKHSVQVVCYLCARSGNILQTPLV